MTKRTQPSSLIPIPETIDPDGVRCFIVQVPDDPRHVSAFRGMLSKLATWQVWENDADKSARLCAEVWKRVNDFITQIDCSGVGTCDMNFRQNGCLLEYSIDCEHWFTLYDPTLCIVSLSGQPAPGGEVAVGETFNACFDLDANGKLLLPIPVSEGYKITITGAEGGWSDGTSAWNCPDGTPYVLGFCAGAAGHSGTDPSADAFHMELIAEIAGILYPAYNTTIIVPAGTSASDIKLYANDEVLSDNFGSIHFCIKVEGLEVATWEHSWDFRLVDGAPSGGFPGWIDRTDAPGTTWVSGQGWSSHVAGSGEAIGLEINFSPSPLITDLFLTLQNTATDGISSGAIENDVSGGHSEVFVMTAGLLVEHWQLSGGEACTRMLIAGSSGSSAGTPSSVITNITIRGRGTDPFI